MPVIDVPGTGLVEFPDTMSLNDIESELDNHYQESLRQGVQPIIGQPRLGPKATLPDAIAQPVPRLNADQGGVVRSALPGVLQPEDLMPAARKIGGNDQNAPSVEIDQRGFAGPSGEYAGEPVSPNGTDQGKHQDTSMMAQLPSAIFGRKEEDVAAGGEIARAQQKYGRFATLPGDPEQQQKLDDIERQYKNQWKMLPWDTDPIKANEGAARITQEMHQAYADMGIQPVEIGGKPRFGEAMSHQQQDLLLGKGHLATAIGAAQRNIQGLAESIVQPETVAMLPGTGGIKSLADLRKITGQSFIPGMVVQTGEQLADTVKNVWHGDFDKAIESGVGAATTGIMLAMPVYAARAQAEWRATRKAFLEEPLEQMIADKEKELSDLDAKTDLSPEAKLSQGIQLRKERADLTQRADLRDTWEQNLNEYAKGTGRSISITDDGLGRGVIAQKNENGTISINRKHLHLLLEHLAKGDPETVQKAIESLVNQEVIHAAISNKDAAKFWRSLTSIERGLEESLYDHPEGASDEMKGQEAMRRRLELAHGLTPGELIKRSALERWSYRSKTALLQAFTSIRESLATSGEAKTKLDQQIEMLNKATHNIIEAQKGAKDAVKEGQVEAGVPTERAGDGKGGPPAEAGPGGGVPTTAPVAQEAPLPLTEAKVPEKAPPAAPTGEALPAAPAAAKAEAGVSAPAGPAISEPKPVVQEVKQGLTPEQSELHSLRQVIRERELTPQETERMDELIARGVKMPRREAPQSPAMRLQEPKEMADQLGLSYRGKMKTPNRTVDQYLYDAPNSEGRPSGITITVPEGSDIGAIKEKMKSRLAEFGIESKDLDAKEFANKTGWTFKPTGLAKTEGMPPELKKAMEQFAGWEFTDRRRGSQTEGVTFYTKQGVTAEQIGEAYNNKMGQYGLGADTSPKMRLSDMGEKDAEDYMRPLLAAAGDDPAKKEAVYDFVRQQIEAEAEQEFKANQPIESETEMGVGPEEKQSPAGVNVQLALEGYLGAGIEPKQLTKEATSGGPVTPEYTRPTFRDFVKTLSRQMPGASEDSLRWLWIEKVHEHLINASGKRLEDWRKALKLEGRRRYGTRPIADPPVEMTAEQKADFIRTTKDMSDAETANLVRESKKGQEADQNYRRRLISEISKRLINEAIPREHRLGRGEITAGEVEHYRSFGTAEGTHMGTLEDSLVENARYSKHATPTKTKRVTVLVNRKTGAVDAVSTYKHPKTGQVMLYDPIIDPYSPEESKEILRIEKETADAIKLGKPAPAPFERKGISTGPIDKHHHPLKDLIKQYRVKATMLLNDPVQNFHQRWEKSKESGLSAEQQFMRDMGDELEASSSENDAIWKQFQIDQEAAELGQEEGESYQPQSEAFQEPLSDAPAGTTPQDLSLATGELPSTQVEKSEGSVFSGPHADIARSKAGTLRSNLKYFTRGPMTGAEARGFVKLLSDMEVSGVGDIREALKILADKFARPDPITHRRYVLRGDEYSALSAIDKAVKKQYFELRQEPDVKDDLAELKDPTARAKYLEGVKIEAMSRALHDLYEIADKTKSADNPSKRLDYDFDQFAVEALDRYGDHTRRAFEQAQTPEVSKTGKETVVKGWVRTPQGLKWKERSHTGEALMMNRVPPTVERVGYPPGIPLKRRLGPTPTQGVPGEARLPELLDPEARSAILQRAEQEHGPKLPDIPPEVINPSSLEFGKKKAVSTSRYSQRPSWLSLSPTERETMWQRVKGDEGGKYVQAPRELKGPLVRESKTEPAMRLKMSGTSQKAWDEMVRLGAAYPVEPGEGVSPKEGIEHGRSLIAAGFDPIQSMEHYEETGRFGYDDVAAARAWGEKLQKDYYDAADHNGEKDPHTAAAKRASYLWQERFKKMHTDLSKGMVSLQGQTDVDTGNLIAMEEEHRRRTGKAFTEEQKKVASKHVEDTKKADAKVTRDIGDMTSAINQPEKLDPQTKSLVDTMLQWADKTQNDALSRIRKRRAEGRMFSALTIIPPEDLADYAAYGAATMVKLSVKGGVKLSAWKKQMIADIGEYIKPHLDDIWAEAEKVRDQQAERVGTGPAFEPVKKAVKRVDPSATATVEDARKAIAMGGRKTFTTQQARALWNYVKKRFLDQGETDFSVIRRKAAIELGVPMEEVTRALAANKTMRKITDQMYEDMADRRRVVADAKNWLKNQEADPVWRFARKIPRAFFIAKVFGHGTVGLVTHASNMIFNPYAWKTYFPMWKEMYKMVLDKGYHERAMRDLMQDPNYIKAKRAGLQNDPFKHTDDYSIVALTKFFTGMGNRGFDALKTLRQARWNQMWENTPDNLKTPEMAKLWADSVNHATGIVQGRFREWSNWTFFAPKLEGSRWAFMFADPAKAALIGAKASARAAGIFEKWDNTSPEQRMWAMSEFKQKAAMAGMYFSLLAMNQGLLKAMKSDQEINWDNPKKADFMAFKVAGFNVGLISPILGMVRMLFNMVHAAQGHRTEYEQTQTRLHQMESVGGDYLRGKLSPFASSGVNAISGSDFQQRPMPWSSERIPAGLRKRGISRYGYGEYLSEQLAPIPFEEALKEVWKGQGMNESQYERWLRAITVVGTMMATGARVTEDRNR